MADFKTIENIKIQENKKATKKKKKTNEYKSIVIIVSVIIIINIIFNIFNFIMIKNNSFVIFANDKLNKNEFYTSLEINKFVQVYISKNRMNEIVEFYNQFVRDYELTTAIIESSIKYDIPTNILFGLIYQESNFNFREKNQNKDGSFDIGLMQLNSTTYKSIIEKNGIEYLLNPYNNLELGCKHLKENYNEYGNWYLALLSYNAGIIKSNAIYYQTLCFLTNIISYEKKLDEEFNKKFN